MALTAHDGQWEADVVLSDGGTVHVRPIRPADATAFRARYRLHGRTRTLTEHSRFTRVDNQWHYVDGDHG